MRQDRSSGQTDGNRLMEREMVNSPTTAGGSFLAAVRSMHHRLTTFAGPAGPTVSSSK